MLTKLMLWKPSGGYGEVLSVTRERAGWETISFRLLRLQKGQTHTISQPQEEVDLDEIYFYKISRPEGFAIQRVYTRDGRRAETLTVRDNERVLIPKGYHPVVPAQGYDCHYPNVLAGSARSMAASDDPDYAWVRATGQTRDPRLPLVH